MRRKFRSIVVAVLSALLLMNPALACQNCGSYWSGYSGYGYGGYSDVGYGYASYGYGGGYDSCCGGDVVVDSGCGCDGCGCGGDACDGCVGCAGEEVVEGEVHGDVHRPMTAPEPPVHEPTVPLNNTPPAPALPPQTMPEPEAEIHAMPPATPEEVPPAEVAPVAPMPTEPVESTPVDDLFSTPTTETAPAEEVPAPAAETSSAPADDDLFAPAAEPATESAPAPEGTEEAAPVDDLFAPPPTEEAAPPADAPAEEAAPPAEAEDDLFSNAGSILHLPGGLASLELRPWRDNTGRHSCRGRLLRMRDGKVQILKDNGRTTTVPLARLSAEDLAFVHRQASAQHSEVLGQTAQANAGR